MTAKKAIFILFALTLVYCILQMRPTGAPAYTEMDEYFILNSQKETAANNVVSSIVFDYRGLDTLGEATVLFTAVTAIILLLRDDENE